MDTIVALATPVGRSGIAVIRLSGDAVLDITRKLVLNEQFKPKPRIANLKSIYDSTTQAFIDDAVVTYFENPHSFTGEDVVEISCHGAPVLIRQIIDSCLKLNARIADPGEFSLRALSNGKLNLSQAEAIRDLIDARTIASAQQAARQLRGELSNQLQPLKNDLLDVIIILESALEFVEDDLPDFQIEEIKQKLAGISDNLRKMSSTFQSGKLLREGIKVALAGRPNVGKSSLFNSLVGFERAIVTNTAGTTRDALYENLNISGVPVSLIDTAGMRETTDEIESIGVSRTRGTINDADLVIVVLDSSDELHDDDFKILEEVNDLNHIVAVNKVDLNNKTYFLDKFNDKSKFVFTSAKTGIGLEILQRQIISPFVSQDIDNKGFLVSDARHHDLLMRAYSEVENSLILITGNASEEIILIGLHNALNLLGQITGETSTEDMLTRIFSTFCIGK